MKNTNTTIKAIIFDFAGVIGSEGHWILLKDVLPNLESQRVYIQKIDNKVDKGLITNKKYSEIMSKITGIPANQVGTETIKRITINDDLLAFILQLKQKYKIGLFSNFTYEWLEKVIAKYNLKVYFDSIYISSKYGMIKPEKGAFHKMLELLQVKPNEAIFIDDRQTHINAANKLGIKSFFFVSNELLKKDFMNMGI